MSLPLQLVMPALVEHAANAEGDAPSESATAPPTSAVEDWSVRLSERCRAGVVSSRGERVWRGSVIEDLWRTRVGAMPRPPAPNAPQAILSAALRRHDHHSHCGVSGEDEADGFGMNARGSLKGFDCQFMATLMARSAKSGSLVGNATKVCNAMRQFRHMVSAIVTPMAGTVSNCEARRRREFGPTLPSCRSPLAGPPLSQPPERCFGARGASEERDRGARAGPRAIIALAG